MIYKGFNQVIKSVAAIAGGFFLILGNTALAQEEIARACQEAYQDNFRNITITERSFSEMHAIYDNYCSADGEVRSGQSNFSLEAVVKKIPVKFTGGRSSNLEKMSSFCRNYQEVRYSSEYSDIRTSEIVVAAMQAFNQCIAIANESNGLTVTHSFAGPGSISFFFDFGQTNLNLVLEGVSHSENIECWSTSPELPSGGQKQIIDTSQSYTLTDNFNVVCDRNGRKVGEFNATLVAVGDNEDFTKYEFYPSWINVATNFGPYTISLPQDTVYSHHLASEATGTIAGLESANSNLTLSLEDTRQDLSQTQRQVAHLKAAKIKTAVALTGNPHPGGRGTFFTCGTTTTQILNAMCPANRYWKRQAVQVYGRGGGQCGYAHYGISCLER